MPLNHLFALQLRENLRLLSESGRPLLRVRRFPGTIEARGQIKLGMS